MDKNALIEGKIGSTLLRFAGPFMLASLLQALYGAADLFMVGRFASSAAVAAVGTGSQVMHTMTGIILGISTGGTVAVANAIGERNDERAARSVGSLAALFAILAVVLTPVMLLCTDFAVRVMHTPTEAIEYAKQYIFICACGLPFIIGYNGVSGIFRGMGDSKTPVYFVAAACVINIVFDYILVGIFGMGAAGAAIATIFAQAVSFFGALIYMAKKGLTFHFTKRHFGLHRSETKYILKIGTPLALQDALVNVSFLIITAIINVLGVVASAAVGVVERIIGFAMLPPGAFSSAVATMTAQNMGAGKPERARSSLKHGIGYSLIFGIAVCLYSQFFPQSITALFSTDIAVIEAAGMYLKAFSIDCIFVSFVFCLNSYFSGCGNSLISMAHSLTATFCVRIPLSYLLSRAAGNTMYLMGLAAPAASTLSIIICFAYFRLSKKSRP